jgi:hypothetical protein
VSVRSLELLAGGGLTRREMVGSLARWAVPTVVTLALGARRAKAQTASCPPCTRPAGPNCVSCNTNQILNCKCEPCLGPPYCGAAAAAPASPLGVSAAPGSAPAMPGVGAADQKQLDDYLRVLRGRASARGTAPFGLGENPFARSPFPASPFGSPLPGGGRSAPTPFRTPAPQSLYDRLRATERRPF